MTWQRVFGPPLTPDWRRAAFSTLADIQARFQTFFRLIAKVKGRLRISAKVLLVGNSRGLRSCAAQTRRTLPWAA